MLGKGYKLNCIGVGSDEDYMLEVAFPYGSYLRGESRDCDYITLVFPPRLTAAFVRLGVTFERDGSPFFLPASSDISHDATDVLSVSFDKDTPLNQMTMDQAMALLNLSADYPNWMVELIIKELTGKILSEVMWWTVKVFFDKESGNLALRRGAFDKCHTYFRLRKLLFAYLQDKVWREWREAKEFVNYEKLEGFVNYKSGLIERLPTTAPREAITNILMDDFQEWKRDNIQKVLDFLDTGSVVDDLTAHFYSYYGDVNLYEIENVIEGDIEKIEAYWGGGELAVKEIQYEAFSYIAVACDGSRICLSNEETYLSLITVEIKGRGLKLKNSLSFEKGADSEKPTY